MFSGTFFKCSFMIKGICSLSIVPLRAEPSHKSEMISQILFGETFSLLQKKDHWHFVKLDDDGYEGWVDEKQLLKISKDQFDEMKSATRLFSSDPVNMLQWPGGEHQLVVMGSSLYADEQSRFSLGKLHFNYSGEVNPGKLSKTQIPDLAFTYLNTPYLWGGKSPFGIDCSGFTQMVYKMAGWQIPRDAKDQVMLGEPLSFIEEAEPGDLAFFDNEEGQIVHVGILLEDQYIIHASGKVRIDRLDQFGIANNEMRKHSHRLRVIKKII
jgi:hypothetical protein